MFSFSLPSCSIPRTEFSCITAPVAYAATHYSNPMPMQTQAFSLPRNKRYSLPVDYHGFFAYGLLSPALLWLTWFFLQTSPDTYYTYEPSLIFRAYRPLISICCPYLSGRLWFSIPELIRFKVKSRIYTVFRFLFVLRK